MTAPNEAAFARPVSDANPSTSDNWTWSYEQVGLTKREYFAARALQGLLANPNVDTLLKESDLATFEYENAAVAFADRLITALNKESK